MQLRLRDVEVENDDIERQARNTSSSLEDLESKYNVAIERTVLMEEEIRTGEQERENLRIDTQRLRNELSDLKIEMEIMQGKLRKRPFPEMSPESALSNDSNSVDSTISSHTATTPLDTKSVSTLIPGDETPPSPPISETSGPAQLATTTPKTRPKSRLKSPSGGSSTTPKQITRPFSSSLRSSRGSATSSSSYCLRNSTPSITRQNRTKVLLPSRGLPNSNSLTHIRTLTAKVQKLERRVQSARSKLPTPIVTPPRSSPHSESLDTNISSSITIRNRKRIGKSDANMPFASLEDTSSLSSKNNSRLSNSKIARSSFGSIQRQGNDYRPSSPSTGSYIWQDRPSSRIESTRPSSRASLSGSRCSLIPSVQSHYSESVRPRLSLGSSHGSSSQSVITGKYEESMDQNAVSSARRNKSRKSDDIRQIPVLTAGPRRKSGPSVHISRQKEIGDIYESEIKPASRLRKLSDLGETY